MQIKKPILFVILLQLTFSLYGQIKTKNTPSWVTAQSFEKDPGIDMDDIGYGLLTLLSDEQIHVPKQEIYVRYVKKITDNVGVQDGSLISINYDPTYQKLYINNVSVIRDGKIINKLNINDFQNIRQESNAESFIYDGSLNATSNLSDIRNGDIVDYSYTISGFNPLNKKFSGFFVMNDYQPVGKIHGSILSKNELKYKMINGDITPIISNQLGLKKYSWTNTNTIAPVFEENTAQWYMSYQNVFISEYDTWEDVVDWALPLYTKDRNLSATLSKKIKTIKNASEFEVDRIKMAVKFVQNEVRYLGLESGIGGYKPFKPNKVMEQRFGDCKDKSWLLVTMLRELEIEAYPVLIHSTLGNALNEFLPTPKAFDHVVVKVIDSTKTGRFFDPTISNQEGSFKTMSFPNYNKGLVIKKGTKDLEIIENESQDLVEVFDTYDLKSVGGDMTLNIISVYHQGEADAMRTILKSNSIKSLNKDYRDYYKKFYEDAEILKEMTFEDDTLYNEITIEEAYTFKNVWKPMIGDEDQIGVSFTPYSLYNNIVFPTEKTRKTPYKLYYPIDKKHNITVKLPTAWGLKAASKNIISKDFEYRSLTKSNPSNNILYLNYAYKNKKGYVAPEDFERFYNDYKKMEQDLSYYIYIPKSYAKFNSIFSSKKDKNDTDSSESSEPNGIIMGFLVVIFLGIIGLVIYIVRGNRKYNS